MAAKQDMLVQLPRLAWRGMEVPITKRSLSFEQEQASHKIIYRDDHFIESTGAGNLRLRYTIPFRQGIAKGPYKDLFLAMWPRFLGACRDRTPDTLTDPVIGNIPAKVVSYSDELDVNKRDGIDADVEFIHAPPLDGGLFSVQVSASSLVNEGGALDKAIAATGITQLQPPEPFQDLLGQINGMLRMLDRAGARIAAALDSVSMKLENLEASVAKLKDAKNAPIIRAARRLRGNIQKVSDHLTNPMADLVVFTTTAASTIGTLAGASKTTTAKILEWNPGLAKTPLIPAGTSLLVPKAA